MLGVWQYAKRFPREEAIRIQGNVERFLATSPLTSCKNFVFRVPGNSEHNMQKAKEFTYQILGRIKRKSFWMFDFVSRKLSIIRDKKNMFPACSSHTSSLLETLMLNNLKSCQKKIAHILTLAVMSQLILSMGV